MRNAIDANRQELESIYTRLAVIRGSLTANGAPEATAHITVARQHIAAALAELAPTPPPSDNLTLF